MTPVMTEMMENEIPNDWIIDHPRLSSAGAADVSGPLLDMVLGRRTLIVSEIVQSVLVFRLTCAHSMVMRLRVSINGRAGHGPRTWESDAAGVRGR